MVLRALGPTHTRGDTVAFVEPDRVLFAGDIVMNKRFLAFSAQSSASAWLKVLDQLEPRSGPAQIVPSHGAMGDATLIAQQRSVLQQIQARVKRAEDPGADRRRGRDDGHVGVPRQVSRLDDARPRRAARASFYGEPK